MPPKSPLPNKKKHQIQPDANDQPPAKKAKTKQDIEQHEDVEMATEDDQSKSVADVKSRSTDPIKPSVKALSPKITAEKSKKRKLWDETDAMDDELFAEDVDNNYISDPTSFEAKNCESIDINDFSNEKELSDFLNEFTTTKSLGLELIYKDDGESDSDQEEKSNKTKKSLLVSRFFKVLPKFKFLIELTIEGDLFGANEIKAIADYVASESCQLKKLDVCGIKNISTSENIKLMKNALEVNVSILEFEMCDGFYFSHHKNFDYGFFINAILYCKTLSDYTQYEWVLTDNKEEDQNNIVKINSYIHRNYKLADLRFADADQLQEFWENFLKFSFNQIVLKRALKQLIIWLEEKIQGLKEAINEEENDLDKKTTKEFEKQISKLEKLQAIYDNANYWIKHNLYSPYPMSDFTGDDELKEERDDIRNNEYFDVENRVAATLIGYPLSTESRFFPQYSPFSKVTMKKTGIYFRNSKHILHKIYAFKDSKTHKNRGLGNIPASGFFGEISGNDFIDKYNDTADIYDFYLTYKLYACAFIRDECRTLQAAKVNFFHDYPCLMIYLNDLPDYKLYKTNQKPWTSPEISGWTNLVISFFVGLMNYKAFKSGINIELVMRPSFGFLTPTIDECEQSIRINIGVIPKDYMLLLIEGLKILNEVLILLKNKDERLSLTFPRKGFLSANKLDEYKEYKVGDFKINDIWDAVWTGITKESEGDKKENRIQTGAIKLTDGLPVARIQLAMTVYNNLIKQDEKSFDNLKYANTFLDAIRWGFGQCEVKKQGKNKRLTFVQNEDAVKVSNITSPAEYKLIDTNFFKLILNKIDLMIKRASLFISNESLIKIRNEMEIFIKNNDIGMFYHHIQKFNELLFAKSLRFNASIDDPYGSASDTDDDEKEHESKIYAKKAIVNHGMVSIHKSILASAKLLNKPKIKICLHANYYEVNKKEFLDELNEALRNEKIEIEKSSRITDRTVDIVAFDSTPCATDNKEYKALNLADFVDSAVWLIDTTSATTKHQQDYVKQFRKQKNAKILFFVSSGLKNEQGGADKLPYGTIRYFTKDIKTRDELTKLIRPESEYVSGLSHTHRRLMKILGLVPCNIKLINGTVKQDKKKTNDQKNSPPQKPPTNSFSHHKYTLPIWYREDDIKALLKMQLKNKAIVFSQTQLEHKSLLTSNLQQAIDGVKENMPVVMPIHVHGNHWASLVIKKYGKQIQVIYNDPKGRSIQSEPAVDNFMKAATESKQDITVFDLCLKQQTNDNDCGVFTVDNCIRLTLKDTSKMTNDEIGKLLAQYLIAALFRRDHETIINNAITNHINERKKNMSNFFNTQTQEQLDKITHAIIDYESHDDHIFELGR